jgi:hypothetical protein
LDALVEVRRLFFFVTEVALGARIAVFSILANTLLDINILMEPIIEQLKDKIEKSDFNHLLFAGVVPSFFQFPFIYGAKFFCATSNC